MWFSLVEVIFIPEQFAPVVWNEANGQRLGDHASATAEETKIVIGVAAEFAAVDVVYVGF